MTEDKGFQLTKKIKEANQVKTGKGKEVAKVTKTTKVTEKQKLFIDNYIISLNGTDAYMQAYGAKNRNLAGVEAHNLLSKPNIKAQIEKRMEEIKTPLIADAQQVLAFLTDMMDNKKAKDSDRITSAVWLGKRYGLFTERIDLNQSLEIEINIGSPELINRNDEDTIDIEFEEVD